jgi:hypothetical protein
MIIKNMLLSTIEYCVPMHGTFVSAATFNFLSSNCFVSHRTTTKHRWFSGRMLACHAGGPGSIPGRCIESFSSYTFNC